MGMLEEEKHPMNLTTSGIASSNVVSSASVWQAMSGTPNCLRKWSATVVT
eukprot:CAMPEP_0175876982 /NCGR_PEP_ID=MMETSP0107_2-20121207/40353_1 /TAXON_ID=195067 ORGANISM="Goniomonas pacifica, Strain CCMP1869" /NCGR_SAMPLE_ID=MMETSP0107_2 /ASSEMBLY_ACC=CAM_ASM_000203 /LENGTH=49 /DNA_ID= /DNA_START= /DNA_END= /DNA_ORIENTATION=